MDARKLATTSRNIRKLLVAAALSPMLLSMAAHWVGATQQNIVKQKQQPALVFGQYLVNLGEVSLSSQKYAFARFTFINRGKHSVKITELKPSCGCLQPQLQKKEYQPGEMGEFLLRMTTAGESAGLHEYVVTMKYNDPQPREQTLQFKLILPEKQIDIQPRALIFYQLNGDPATQEFVLTDYRSTPCNVLGVDVNSEYVTTKLLSTGKDEDGFHQVRISATVKGKIPPGKHRALIKITTDDSTYDKLYVPLWIQGPTAKVTSKKNKQSAIPQ